MTVTRWRVAAMLMPAMLVVAGFFGLGMFEVMRQSVGLGSIVAEQSPGPTLAHYAALLRDREIHAALGLTLWVASISTALSVVCGVGLALGLRRGRRARRGSHTLLQAPLALPHLVVALVTITVFAQSGLLARAAFALGLIDTPSGFPVLVNDAAGIGIILAYAFKEVPFIALVATALLARRSDEYDELARTLGASSWQRFRHVTWPFLAPGVGAAALMIFAYVFSAFETPFLLGQPYPSMLPVVAQQRFMSIDLADRPAAMACAFMLTVIAAVVVRFYLAAAGPTAGRERPVLF
ncbi:MAG TPA: ABC transporter permease subunit [Vicinamibacterales bacterium]|nr:ABC transporter permease subunit [Vicinamibacterales bacterium]